MTTTDTEMMDLLDEALFGLGYVAGVDSANRRRWSDGRTEIVDDRQADGVYRVGPCHPGTPDFFTADSPAKLVRLIRQAREMFS